MKTIVVTGGAGFIGSHVCHELSFKYKVIVYDNFSTSSQENIETKAKTISLYQKLRRIDIRKTKKLAKLLKKDKPDLVMHFAASAYVGESVNEPIKYYQNNVAGTISLLAAMEKADVRQLVFSSSCATYGICETEITEDTPQKPINPYGRTKLMCEEIIKDYANTGKLKYAILRYFNVAGCDPSGYLGEDHDPETHLIPNVIKAALNNTPVEIYGFAMPTPDGSCIRDYIHVCDLATAHRIVAEQLDTEDDCFIYNVSANCAYSVQEIVKKVSSITGKEIKTTICPSRPGDPAILKASNAKILLDTTWKPAYHIDHMIEHACNYLKKEKQ